MPPTTTNLSIYLLIWRAEPGCLLSQQRPANGSCQSKFQGRNNLMTCLGKDCSKKIPLRSRSSLCSCLRQSPYETHDFPTSGVLSQARLWELLAASCLARLCTQRPRRSRAWSREPDPGFGAWSPAQSLNSGFAFGPSSFFALWFLNLFLTLTLIHLLDSCFL